MTKRKIALFLLLILLASALGACQSGSNESAVKLSFAQSASLDALKALDGKTVQIVGYMATLSPLSGEYIYLMNLPYQSCPFCVPNTTQLANTMAVYAKSGSKFAYTDQAIRVTGTLSFGDSRDDFGYVYNYRIVNAAYETVDLSTVSAEYALWTSIAEDGLVADVDAMFQYLYFVCDWPSYQVNYTDDDGNAVSYFLWPGDALNYLQDTGPYGYAAYTADDYFPSLIRRVEAISKDGLSDLIEIVESAQTLASEARIDLDAGLYTFNPSDETYTLTNGVQLVNRFNDLYSRFGVWLTKWEL